MDLFYYIYHYYKKMLLKDWKCLLCSKIYNKQLKAVVLKVTQTMVATFYILQICTCPVRELIINP